MKRLPHPIPYQGSKRRLAATISNYFPSDVNVLFEPFAGSAAMTIYAAYYKLAKRFVVSDTLETIVQLLSLIVEHPLPTASSYSDIWHGQKPDDTLYFNQVRERYNDQRDPVDLLYLICRCVKNSVRFNANGNFTQSVDKRRLGMNPSKMTVAIEGVSHLLHGKIEFRVGDWKDTTKDVSPNDFVYLDPPYLGTSIGRDKRYHRQLTQESIIEGIESYIKRDIRFALSYDGRTGDREYGPPLPDHLDLTHLLLNAGRSSQSTLSGRNENTIESLYLSNGLAKPSDNVIQTKNVDQHFWTKRK